ncbi:putative aldehyde reductase [Xylogone sp. PMI_703]|nr:putative aldehyde reductase [Xylogone sp. PMI_703]
MQNRGAKLVFGGAMFMVSPNSPEQVDQVLKTLEEAGIDTIDTAQTYGKSEELLGQANAASRFVIDTKHCGGMIPGESTKDKVVARGLDSLKRLRTETVDVFYIHVPDYDTPLEDTLAGINELYQAGKFKRFGLSNFSVAEVEEVIKIAKQHNYVLPSVYQSNYSAVARRQETEVFPTLHKYGIAFYSYSPLAGGFLTKTADQILHGTEGRWDPETVLGKLHRALYQKPALLKALSLWDDISNKHGIPKAELGYRWVVYNSGLSGERGDAVILGASNIDQLQETLKGLRNGPLSEEVVKEIDAVWQISKNEVHLDNFEGFLKN